MDIQKAKIYLYAIDCGSLSKAATAYGYTPSGISHMMTAFESEVGFSLLIRTKTGVLPTPNGEKLIPAMRALCQWEDQFEQVTSGIRGLVKGTLTIATYSSIGSQWLPKVIAAFSRDYPGIEIHILDGVWQEVEDNLSQRKADLGFYSYQPVMRHHWVPLKEDPMVLAVPKNHRFVKQGSVRLKDLAEEQLIMPAFGSDIDVLNLLEEEDLKPKSSISTLQNYSALGMVEQGLGVLVTNELITKGRTNDLVLLPFDPPRSITLGAAIPFENRRTPAVVKFIEYAKDLI